MKKLNFRKLQQKEHESIMAAMAMQTFNPAIGRTLVSGSVNKFIVSSVRELPKLEKISTRAEFDRFHDRWCKKLMIKIRGCGYGSAQKAINVLLKMYVYWSKMPRNWERLKRYLHVPLDSVIIEYFETNYSDQFETFISPLYENYDHDCYNLKHMTRHQYLPWVKLLRKVAEKNPAIEIDILWQIERLRKARAKI